MELHLYNFISLVNYISKYPTTIRVSGKSNVHYSVSDASFPIGIKKHQKIVI
jgi:hypothetical protein